MNDKNNEENKLSKTAKPIPEILNSNEPVVDTTPTISVESTSKAALVNEKLLILEKTTKSLLEKLLAKLKSLKLEGNGRLQKEKQEELLAYLKQQLVEINKLRQELKSIELNEPEKNKSNFLDVCIKEFNKIATEESLGDLKLLQENLSKINDKLETATYPQLSQNKNDPNLYSVSHVSKEQLQEAAKAVCEKMAITYEENANGFMANVPKDKLDEFQTLIMEKIYKKNLRDKQEESLIQNQGEDLASAVRSKK